MDHGVGGAVPNRTTGGLVSNAALRNRAGRKPARMVYLSVQRAARIAHRAGIGWVSLPAGTDTRSGERAEIPDEDAGYRQRRFDLLALPGFSLGGIVYTATDVAAVNRASVRP